MRECEFNFYDGTGDFAKECEFNIAGECILLEEFKHECPILQEWLAEYN